MSDVYSEPSLSYEEVLAILEAELMDNEDIPLKPLNFHTEDDEEEWENDELT